VGSPLTLLTLLGFFYFLVALWRTYFCVVVRNAPPVHGKLEKNLQFHGWAVPVLFDGLSWISPWQISLDGHRFFQPELIEMANVGATYTRRDA
jgi:hypothetical protein